MTWGSKVLGASTPYESFYHRRSSRYVKGEAPPPWSSRSSREMMRASLELQQRERRADTASGAVSARNRSPRSRGSAAASARRPRVARTARAARNPELAVSQSDALRLHFPLVVTPPPTPQPTPPPAQFVGGGSFRRVLLQTTALGTPLKQSSRRLGYTDLDWLLSLTGLEELLSVCGDRANHPGVKLPSGAECINIEVPAFVTAEEEKVMRRHVKWQKRTEQSCAEELRKRLHEAIRPIFDRVVSQAVARARNAIEAANKALVSGSRNVDLLLTELDSALRDPATPKDKTLRDLCYHRALVLARSGRVDQALADLQTGLEIDPSDYRVLKAKYQLEKLRECMEIPSMDAHGDHTRQYDGANPAEAHRPVGQSLTMFLDAYPLKFGDGLDNVPDSELLSLGLEADEIQRMRRAGQGERAQLATTIRSIKRDRPFPQWIDRKVKAVLERPETPPREPVPPPPPSPWNECLDRVRDLLVDEVDDQRTRQMILKHKNELTEIFMFYCRLGSRTTGQKDAQQFSRIQPHLIRPSRLTPQAQEKFCTLFWTNDGEPQRDLCASAPIMPELPTTLITLRQFCRLVSDCSLADGDCTLADVGRMFTFSCRETELNDIESFEQRVNKGQDGYELRLRALREEQEIDSVEALPECRDAQQRWKTVGGFDLENPHHPNNRQHIFRFFETCLRMAHKLFIAEKKNLANCFDTFVGEQLRPHACQHEPTNGCYDALFWEYHSPDVAAVMERYKAPLEKVYRYFSVPNPKAGVQGRNGKALPLWKVRTASLLDNLCDFNEILELFTKCGLFELPMLPKPLGIIFETVTGQSGLAYQVHKNNNDNVMVLEEFYQLMFRVAMAYRGAEAYRGKTSAQVIDTYMVDFFQKCTLVMPINKSVLVKSVGAKEGMDEVFLPREQEVVHSHLNGTQDGSDTLPVKRQPLQTIIDLEKAAAKKRMAAKVAERRREQEESDASAAAAMGLSVENYLRTKPPRVRAETPDGETPLNMWRLTPCGDGFWESAAEDSYRYSPAAGDGAEGDSVGQNGAQSPVIAALE